MKKEFSSWVLLGLFLVVMCSLFIFAFRDKIFGTIQGNSKNDTRSGQSDNILKDSDIKLLKCSKESNEENEKIADIVTITYRGDTLKVYEEEQTTTSNDNVEVAFGLVKTIGDAFSKLDGITMTSERLNDTSFKVYTKIVYDELNASQLSQLANNEDTKDIAKNDIYKNTTIGYNEYQFKLEKDGYSCE